MARPLEKHCRCNMARKAKSTGRGSAPMRTKGGPDSIDAHVGSRVRLRRMVIGMSQESLGKALDLTFQQVQKYEKGANRIGAGRLMQLSQILDVPIQYFYDDFDKVVGAPGFAEDGVGDAFMNFIQSPEGVQLCKYFSAIDDPKVRKRVLDLVRTISETEGQAS